MIKSLIGSMLHTFEFRAPKPEVFGCESCRLYRFNGAMFDNVYCEITRIPRIVCSV